MLLRPPIHDQAGLSVTSEQSIRSRGTENPIHETVSQTSLSVQIWPWKAFERKAQMFLCASIYNKTRPSVWRPNPYTYPDVTGGGWKGQISPGLQYFRGPRTKISMKVRKKQQAPVFRPGFLYTPLPILVCLISSLVTWVFAHTSWGLVLGTTSKSWSYPR